MSKLTRLEKYHLNYVSQRQASKVVAVTPAASEVSHWFIQLCAVGGLFLAARLSETH